MKQPNRRGWREDTELSSFWKWGFSVKVNIKGRLYKDTS